LEQNNGERKLTVAELVTKGFRIVMVVLYVIVGTTIIFKAQNIGNIPSSYALILGVFLIVYGLFRGYKVFRDYFSDSTD
jgi:hypothetical protein